MAFRLLSYMVQVWEGQVNAGQSRKETGQIYPICHVFYTGRKNGPNFNSAKR